MNIKILISEGTVKLKNFINKCVRVLRITKKPTMEEFKAVVKVSSLGIVAIGLIGFFVMIIAAFAGR